MSFLFSSLLRASRFVDKLTCNTYLQHPEITQQTFLMNVLRRNQTTEYGKRYSFSSFKNERDYKNNVPIVDFTDIAPDVNRIKKGEPNILTSEEVFMFNTTSGTTAEPKFIPVTHGGQKLVGRLMRKWLEHSIADHPAMFNQNIVILTGAAVEGHCECGTPFGSASGMIGDSLPKSIKNKFAVPADVFEINDYSVRYYLLARFMGESKLSFIATPNPLTLVKLAETLQHNSEEIVRSIRNGWLSETLTTHQQCHNAGVPTALKNSLKPNPKRAAALDTILNKNGTLLPAYCWPDLELISCWLGGSIGFYANLLNKYYGECNLRDMGYMASEGCITLPIGDATSSGILATQNNYYEFIPESHIDTGSSPTLSVSELEVGSCYKLILTNYNGLYRYDIGDIIRVDSITHQTPMVSFLRKSGNVINIAGEKLHLNHCLSAIKRLQTDHNIYINQFRVVPNQSQLRHEYFFALTSEVSFDDIRNKLIPALDAYLCTENSEYNSRRKSNRLQYPCIHVMDAAWEDAVRQSHAKFQKRDVQYKWAPFSTDALKEDYLHIKYSVQ